MSALHVALFRGRSRADPRKVKPWPSPGQALLLVPRDFGVDHPVLEITQFFAFCFSTSDKKTAILGGPKPPLRYRADPSGGQLSRVSVGLSRIESRVFPVMPFFRKYPGTEQFLHKEAPVILQDTD